MMPQERLIVQRMLYLVQACAQDALRHAAVTAKYLNLHLEEEKLFIQAHSAR
jgi:hypothetical protein